MYKNKLFEQILREADKSRFVNKAFSFMFGPDFLEEYGGDINGYNYNDIIRFVNSSAVDKYKINWQEAPDTLYNDILDAYENYKSKGGSRSQQAKALKGDPKQFFTKNSNLINGKDYIFISSLENDMYYFVQPLSYKCCVFMDSFECGGEGAKWCLGYEKTDSYWKNYCGNNDLFVFVFNKKEFTNKSNKENQLKFMIELSTDRRSTQVWLQSDKQNETVKLRHIKEKFGYDANEILKAVLNEGSLSPINYQEAWLAAKEALNNGKPFYLKRWNPEYSYTVNMAKLYKEISNSSDPSWYFNYIAKQQENKDKKRIVLDYGDIDDIYTIKFPVDLANLGIYQFDEIIIINLDINDFMFRVKADVFLGAKSENPEFIGTLKFESCMISNIKVESYFMKVNSEYMKVLFDNNCIIKNIVLYPDKEIVSKKDIQHTYNMFNHSDISTNFYIYDYYAKNIVKTNSIFDVNTLLNSVYGEKTYISYQDYMNQ